jgi:hypothetical protein
MHTDSGRGLLDGPCAQDNTFQRTIDVLRLQAHAHATAVPSDTPRVQHNGAQLGLVHAPLHASAQRQQAR